MRRRTRLRTPRHRPGVPVEMPNRSWPSSLRMDADGDGAVATAPPPAWSAAKSRGERSISRTHAHWGRALDGELLATPGAPGGKHLAATLGLHPGAEAVLLGAMALLGLKGLLGHRAWGSSGRWSGR